MNPGIVCSLSLIHTDAWCDAPSESARRRWEALVVIYNAVENGSCDLGGSRY